ncbi:unnamed protein product [Oppiella nova]|uniref:Uncharacterized protein n=1 Tax=Oppiella nova TaxID=334625 RepID=A0A7R9M5S1_9ACAR|nr:unnamed protein product [Oppiella nova]CAG2171016.1 unnamed protein product [Oppiella nova]
MVLSTTIDNPFEVIDSLDQLNQREALQPRLFLKTTDIHSIQSNANPMESRVLNKAMTKNETNYIDYTHLDFYQDLDPLMVTIRDNKTHVLVSSFFDIEIVMTINPSLYSQTLHVSDNKYFDKAFGWVLHKHCDPYLMGIYAHFALPVEIDPDRYLTLDGYNHTSAPYLTYIYKNEVQISLDEHELNDMIQSFTDILVPHNSPSISIMGGYYPNTDSNPWFGVFQIYDNYVN